MDFFSTSSSKAFIPFDKKFEFAVRHGFLHQSHQVEVEILDLYKAAGLSLKGHPVQTYSFMKTRIERGMENGDPEILALCEQWGLDPSKKLHQQDRASIQAAWDRIKAARQI